MDSIIEFLRDHLSISSWSTYKNVLQFAINSRNYFSHVKGKYNFNGCFNLQMIADDWIQILYLLKKSNHAKILEAASQLLFPSTGLH